jgi:peptide deformylase
MKRPLVPMDNPVLRQVAEPVTAVELKDLDLKTGLLADLIDTMLHHDGIGLAAPQIGISKRILIVKDRKGVILLINPEITHQSESTSTEKEGCLSCGAAQVRIKRARHIKVRSTKLNGETETSKFRGLLARQVLHENDHLNGRLIIDYEH